LPQSGQPSSRTADATARQRAKAPVPAAASFDTASIKAAIREAQREVPGYTYKGFCTKVMAAGCASYVVSFPGWRAVYLGRTAEIHIEHFLSAN
jgi:uncharacterized protein YbcV (DUF1398 family)